MSLCPSFEVVCPASRLGSRRGLVELVGRPDSGVSGTATETALPEAIAEVSFVEAPAVPVACCTRVVQLVAWLHDRGGQVHINEIGRMLRTSAGNVQNVIAAAVKAGLVRRVGNRTGLVELATATSGTVMRYGGPPAPEAPKGVEAVVRPERLEPGQLGGIQGRVYGALVELGAAVTAKEVAGVLGCRPREAGNALTLLVRGGLAAREAGEGASEGPSRYQVAGS